MPAPANHGPSIYQPDAPSGIPQPSSQSRGNRFILGGARKTDEEIADILGLNAANVRSRCMDTTRHKLNCLNLRHRSASLDRYCPASGPSRSRNWDFLRGHTVLWASPRGGRLTWAPLSGTGSTAHRERTHSVTSAGTGNVGSIRRAPTCACGVVQRVHFLARRPRRRKRSRLLSGSAYSAGAGRGLCLGPPVRVGCRTCFSFESSFDFVDDPDFRDMAS